MESRGVVFGLGAIVGLSTAFVADRFRWSRRDGDELPQLSSGQQVEPASSVSFNDTYQRSSSNYFK